MKTLGEAIANLGLRRGHEPPDPRSAAELEYWLLERRLFSIERLEDTLAQLPDDDRTRPGLERELELARLAAEVGAQRPNGCWCYGLGGCSRVSLPATDDGDDPFPGWRTWCRCDVGQAQKRAFSAHKTALESVRFQHRINDMWGSVPEAFRGWTLETLEGLGPAQRGLARRVREWLPATPRWLYLWGPTGVGKTGAAVGALAALGAEGRTALFTEVRDLLRHLRTSYADMATFASERDRRWDSLVDVEVLVLDDIGAERATDWTIETIGQLVAIRHARLRRTIVTSNLRLADLGDARTSSRIRERCGDDFAVDCSALPELRLGSLA